MLSKEQFEEYKRIYKEEFGEEKFNSRTEAQLLEEAIKLITLMKIIYKPMTQEEYDRVQSRRKELEEK